MIWKDFKVGNKFSKIKCIFVWLIDANWTIDHKNRWSDLFDSTHWADTKYIIIIKLHPFIQELCPLSWFLNLIHFWVNGLPKNHMRGLIGITQRDKSNVKISESSPLVHDMLTYFITLSRLLSARRPLCRPTQ